MNLIFNKTERLKQIEVENKIWIIYLIIIGLSYYSNYYEKDYFTKNNINSKNKYKKINSLIFTSLLLIYAYFEKEAIQSFLNKDKTSTQKKYDNLILFASTAILISGFIFLYIVLDDNNLETEIAFN